MHHTVNRPRRVGHSYTALMRRVMLVSGLILFVFRAIREIDNVRSRIKTPVEVGEGA